MATALLFPGQGAQEVGMGQALAQSFPAAQELFALADSILGRSLSALCWTGPKEALDATVNSQPAIFVTSLAALEWLKQDKPQAMAETTFAAGLSLGEYSALVAAGAIDFEPALKLVQIRGQAMQDAADAAKSGMVSILGLELAQIRDLCNQARQVEVLEVANLLCPGNIVVSGSLGACQRVAALAETAGAMKVIPLAVAGAFHTSLMQPAVEHLQAALANTEIRRPRFPVVSNVNAQPQTEPDEIRRLLALQVVQPVLWEGSLRWLLDHGITQSYEVGPGRVLRGLLKRIDRKAPCDGVLG